MNIAVTGSGGQLGSELCRRLGEAALPLDMPEFDLTDRDRVRSVLVEARPTAVINTAAYTQVDRAEQEAERCWMINSEGVGHLAQACRELDCPLLQISTDYVFGLDQARSTPYREDDEPGPQGIYAASKLGGERKAAAWQRHLIVRTCGLYGKPGPKTPGGNFVDTMLKIGRQRGHVRVVDDQHCTPSYVPHVARAVLFLLEADARGTYHVVNMGATTWHGVAAEVFRLAGMNVTLERITTAEYGAPAPRPGYSLLDTGKYHALGGPAMPSWQEALAEYLASGR
ncbi:MAG TPA: dTDP-4-dehydrorhamnose reductase [Pirellulales bacterium]|jgi:dTDP-4-dehydrorhamnose reductase|nr:dTDP-4-dehydrorhamnose reductase [Pirellulales bacterium]